MMTFDEAQVVAAEWRPKFVDETAFDASWRRCFEMVGDPTPSRLETWLAKDQQKDTVMHAGIVKEPLLPTRSRFELSDCEHCGGKRYVRRDVEISHPDFGKAWPCPSCNR